MPDAHVAHLTRNLWAKNRDRATNFAYVARELLLARLLRVPRMRILFSELKETRTEFDRWFRHTPHEIHFGQFLPDKLAEYDLLVPLNMPDLRKLDGMRHLIAHSPLPIPNSGAIEICDDKLLFSRVMKEQGFQELTPATRDGRGSPYVLKKRIDRAGRHTRVILAVDQEPQLSPRELDDYFRQELLPGRYEYATHVLFMRNRAVRSLSFEYDMGQENQVKGPLRPMRQRMVACRHVEAFSAVLSAIGFEGLCCIDYKLRSGRPVIMEVNPRFGGSLCPYFFSFIRDLV